METAVKVMRTDKAICLCASVFKGGGNNSVTYIMEIRNEGL